MPSADASPIPEPPAKGRRALLAGFARAVKLSALAALLLPAVKFISFALPARPQLVRVNRNLKKGGFIIEADFIIFDQQPEPIAVSRRCTHLGCTLNYHELEGKLICPCHRSRFDITGRRIAGPARRDLARYEISRVGEGDGGGFLVTII